MDNSNSSTKKTYSVGDIVTVNGAEGIIVRVMPVDAWSQLNSWDEEYMVEFFDKELIPPRLVVNASDMKLVKEKTASTELPKCECGAESVYGANTEHVYWCKLYRENK